MARDNFCSFSAETRYRNRTTFLMRSFPQVPQSARRSRYKTLAITDCKLQKRFRWWPGFRWNRARITANDSGCRICVRMSYDSAAIKCDCVNAAMSEIGPQAGSV